MKDYRTQLLMALALAWLAGVAADQSVGSPSAASEQDGDISTVVTNLADSGPGSLRQAILNAAAHAGPDAVTFATNLSGGVITLTSSPLVITNQHAPLLITASNLPGGLGISGGGARQVFIVMPGESLTLDSLSISNGHANNFLDLTALGGGILNYFGTTTVRRCTFVGNDADFGGAIMSYGGVLTADNCTLFNNSALSSGGAVEIGFPGVVASLLQCTLALNTAGDTGGGARFNYGAITMTDCLASENSAASFGMDVDLESDALYASASYNLLSDGDGSGLSDGVNGNRMGTDANPLDTRLGPLRSNGGPTLTCAPLGGSPALDAGDPLFNGYGLFDQRGFPRVANGRVDIGAVEGRLRAFYTFDTFSATDSAGSSSLIYHGDGGQFWNTDHVGRASSAIALNDLVNGVSLGTNNFYEAQTAYDPGNSDRSLGLKGDFTVSAWVYPRVLGGWKILLGNAGPGGAGALYGGLFNSNVVMGFFGNELRGSRVIATGQWTHLAFSYRAHGGEIALYVNGRLDTADFGRANTTRDAQALIGYSEAFPGSYFRGFIDDFAIYSEALAPNQIAALAADSVRPNAILPEAAIAALAASNPCEWSVREIYAHTNTTYSRAFAEAIATTPQLGSVTNYTSSVINRFDPETNPSSSGFFPGDLPWAANNRTPHGLINGDDNNLVLAARATIGIAIEDDYTFGFNSDDGARLRIFGAVFRSASQVGNPSFPNAAVPAYRGDLLNFPGFSTASGTLGVTHLQPGNYDVEFLMWENAGPSFAEVFAARGARTAVDASFRLLSPGLFLPQPSLTLQRTSPSQVRVSWAPQTGCLQAASAVTGPWGMVAGATNGIVLTLSPGRQFLRIVQ